jgi:ATP-dependent DNA ligase
MIGMAKSARATATAMTPIRRKAERPLPSWIAPELCALVKKPPDGPGWLHEIKLDGYRMHARIDQGDVRLLTRNGLDWTHNTRLSSRR